MSCGCGNSNSLTSCTCSDNCPNKTSDITLFDGNFSSIVVPEGASLNEVLALLESYVMTSVSDLNLTFSLGVNCLGLSPGTYGYNQILQAIIDYVCELDIPVQYGGMYAKSEIADFAKLTHSLANSSLLAGSVFKPTSLYDDYSAYNVSTGIWTCPSTGYYDMSFAVRLSSTNETLGWASDKGVVIAGLVLNGTEVMASNCFSPNTSAKYADLSGGITGAYLTAGNTVKLMKVNTIQNYTSVSGDYAAFSIKRIK